MNFQLLGVLGFWGNDLVEILNHPVQPLKDTLKDLADYDIKRKVYTLKKTFYF